MSSSKINLTNFPAEERPRERLRKVGVENLSLREILSLILEKGARGDNVLNLARDILIKFSSLEDLQRASLEELQDLKGIGFAQACKLQASFELGRRTHWGRGQDLYWQHPVVSADEVFNLLRGELSSCLREHFKLISLNSRLFALGIDEISLGSVNASIAHPREIFSFAIRRGAVSIILVHNHPSGNTSPSDEDIKITRRVKWAGEMLGIPLRDHVILSGDRFSSVFDFL